MRIISKFKDYYDGGMGLGHEPSIVYVRQTTDLEDCSAFKDLIYGMKIIKQSLNRNLPYTQTVSVSIIVICNKLFLKLNEEISEISKIDNLNFKSFESSNLYYYKNCFKNILQSEIPKILKWCEVNKKPLVLIHQPLLNVQITLDPNLRHLNFGKVMSTFQVYQELSMFFGNIANPDMVPVTLTDKERLIQHGFDEWTFRKKV